MTNPMIRKVMVVAAVLALGVKDTQTVDAREVLNFNSGWSFARFGAMPDGSQVAEPAGLEQTSFDDSNWRKLNLPHDWAIEGPFRADLPNRTGKLPYEGIGWYRKTFTVPASDAGKRFYVDFDGAMSRCRVWLNDQYVGEWPYGYASFRLELTKHLKIGGKNVIAVRLENKPEASRWYPGGGIYRNVRLVKTAPVHVGHWGLHVTTPDVSPERAKVKVATEIDGELGQIEVEQRIRELGSDRVVVTGKGADCTMQVNTPKLWDLESPNLYVLDTVVMQDGEEVDAVETTFGIRTIEFTPDRGFLLNRKVTKVNGVCLHHDLGPLGAAFNTRAAERQLKLLQEMGCNAIRTAHNPPAPEFLELCDRMGMLVQVEAFDCWKKGKTPNDYSNFFLKWHQADLEAMVKRDRNHPSVFMWSTGNEIPEQFMIPEGHKISGRLTKIVHDLDSTRPVTAGCNKPNSGFNGFQKTIDVFGFNYKPHLYEEFRDTNPDQPLYGSETASCVSSRGEYFFPVSDDKLKGQGGYFQVSSYDLTAGAWGTIPDTEFAAQDKYPFVFGEFVWSGFDYLGEPTPYNKDNTNLLNFTDPKEREAMKRQLESLGTNIPPRSSYFGILDLCGFPKDRYYIYQAKWRPDLPMAHILPHWNWPKRIGKVTPVHVYTSGDEAELFLNGRSLGRRKKGQYEYRLRWDDVVYQPGEIKVVTFKNGKPWAENAMKTTGKPAKVDLVADRCVISADGSDLSFITVQISDEQGLLIPHSGTEVEFRIDGPGEIIAVGNGNPTSHEPFIASKRKAFNGLCLVIVRSKKGTSGTICLTAVSKGLEKGTVEVKSR